MNIASWYSQLKAKLNKSEFEKLKNELDIGQDFEQWRYSARKHRAKLTEYVDNEIIGGILDNAWERSRYLHFSREDYYDLGESPLEVLEQCIVGDYCTYPPPEILIIIARQFRHYLAEGGDISMEEAFFGKSVGRGTYAARSKKDNSMYEFFHRFISNNNTTTTQANLVEALVNADEHIDHPQARDISLENGKTVRIPEPRHNPMHHLSTSKDFDVESFLKGYRRWKKQQKRNA